MNLDALQELDKTVLLAFNGSGNLFMDYFVLTLTSAYTWIAFYVSLLYLVVKNNENWLKIVLVIGAVALGLMIVDGANLAFVKPFVARLRPLEAPGLQGLVVPAEHYRAEGYSFFSSHAANAFVVAVFFALLVRDRFFTAILVAWSTVVSLTRLYLGVHYPSDVLTGMLSGSAVAVFVYGLYRRLYIRCSDKLHYISTKYTRTGYSFADVDAVLCILLLTFIYAAFRAVLSI